MAELPKASALSRRRVLVHREAQTDASFVPSCADLQNDYETKASEQYSNLLQLRTVIQLSLRELATNAYDVVNFKDVLFKLEEQYPTSLPVTDMLLLSSKLFRHTTELVRLIQCFFGIVFSDDHVDEHFHFTEIRLLQRELQKAKRQLKESDEEKKRLQDMLNNVGQVAIDHGKAVQLLENHNRALQVQTGALEDQMALLFHQLNTDLEKNCKEAYDKVASEMEMQERMNPARTTFRQTMDSLSQQLRSSRTLISEVRETLLSCNQGVRTGEAYLAIEPSVRFKLKVLDSNFQQLVGRFNAVKDTVVETAQELMGALHERKKILYLSFQHIRLYDLQNAKLRHGKAILNELRQYTSDLLNRVQVTFPSGALTTVDRIGRIATQRWQGGYTLAALRQNKAAQAAAENGTGGSAALSSLPGLTEAEVLAAESELTALAGGMGVVGRGAMGAVSGGTPPSLSVGVARAKESGGAASASVSALTPSANYGRLPSTANDASSTTVVEGKETTSPPSPAGGGGGGGAIQPVSASGLHVEPFNNIRAVSDLVRRMDHDIDQLTEALTVEDEVSAFLKTLTLSVSSTARVDADYGSLETQPAPTSAKELEQFERAFEQALRPTGDQATSRQTGHFSALQGSGDGGTGGSTNVASEDAASRSDPASPRKQPVPSGGASAASSSRMSDEEGHTIPGTANEAVLALQTQQLQRQQQAINKLQEDFASKLGFLRQVYEARIADLELKEASVKNTLLSAVHLSASGGGGAGGLRRDTVTAGGADTMTTPASAAGRRRGGKGTKANKTVAVVRDVNVKKGRDEDLQKIHRRSDRDELLQTRIGWRKAKQALHATKPLREAAAAALSNADGPEESTANTAAPAEEA